MHKFSTAATALHSKEIWGQPTRFPTCEVGCLPFEAGKRVGCPHISWGTRLRATPCQGGPYIASLQKPMHNPDQVLTLTGV